MMKWMPISISFLLLLSGFGSNPSQVSNSCYLGENGKILYVGGNGEGNYTSIQDAINDAKDGYTIYVYPGYYNERVVVNKSISLIGIVENGEKPIIDVSGEKDAKWIDAIWIATNDVAVKNFFIKNYGNASNVCRGIFVCGIGNVWHRENIRIENCTFLANLAIIAWANNTIIANNSGNIENINNSDTIISIIGSNNKIIFNNVSYGKDVGIEIDGKYNIISHNTVYHSRGGYYDFGMGISCSGFFNNISYNVIDYNKIGVELESSFFFPSGYNEVYKNYIYKCGKGIYLSSHYNHIYENNISSCNTGIGIYGGCYNVIENNTIYNNSWAGIEMDGAGEEINFPVKNNTIRYNKIIKNSRFFSIDGYCNNNYIIRNDFIDYGKLAGLVAEIYVPSKKISIINKWDGNYWDDWNKRLPKPIKGYVCVHFGNFTNVYPFVVFDWHPSLQPNCS